jgi:hypothetical protein
MPLEKALFRRPDKDSGRKNERERPGCVKLTAQVRGFLLAATTVAGLLTTGTGRGTLCR